MVFSEKIFSCPLRIKCSTLSALLFLGPLIFTDGQRDQSKAQKWSSTPHLKKVNVSIMYNKTNKKKKIKLCCYRLTLLGTQTLSTEQFPTSSTPATISIPSPPDLHAVQISASEKPSVHCQHLPILFPFFLQQPAYAVLCLDICSSLSLSLSSQ